MGRFTVVDNPDKAPGVDYVTGTSVGPFIDTGRDITIGERKFGRIFLSEDTVREMARELGIISDDNASEGALSAAYARGQLESVREDLGGNVARAVAVLGSLADGLRSADLAAREAAEGDD